MKFDRKCANKDRCKFSYGNCILEFDFNTNFTYQEDVDKIILSRKNMTFKIDREVFESNFRKI